MRIAIIATALAALGFTTTAAAQPFEIRAPDGQTLHGQVDRPDGDTGPPRTAVIMVPGTGPFDRDASFGKSGTEDDRLFKALAARLAERGVSAVRFDLRGVGHGGRATDPAVMGRRTTTTMRDDLGAIYDWARASNGLAARCIILFGHSEGMAHIGRLADAGAPAPLAVFGMGALMQSPVQVIRWQLTERDGHSLRLMDRDADGRTTPEEVRAHIGSTPAAVYGMVEPYLLPGGWGAAELAQLKANQTAAYEAEKARALAKADTDAYPSAEAPFAAYQWWKSWFTDERPVAASLARWNAPVRLHYGDRDSQTNAEEQAAAARAALEPSLLSITVHPGRGHSLGEHVLFGPVDPTIAGQMALEMAEAASRCP